ncbi:MAG: hypothetical protein U0694_24905 [Anaerolineae bacterium]
MRVLDTTTLICSLQVTRAAEQITHRQPEPRQHRPALQHIVETNFLHFRRIHINRP